MFHGLQYKHVVLMSGFGPSDCKFLQTSSTLAISMFCILLKKKKNLCSVYLVKVLIIYPMPGQTLSAYRALQKNNLKKLLNTLCTSKSWKIERGCWLKM
jgi:hypothetical protein